MNTRSVFKGMKLNKEDFGESFMDMESIGNDQKKAEVIQRIRYFLQEKEANIFAKLIEAEDWKGLILASQELKKKSQPIEKRS